MKKSFVFALILAAAAAALMIYSHGRLSADAVNVSFSERTLLGDISAAEGLTVKTNVNCDRRLFWHTEVCFGCEISERTDFSFSASRVPESYRNDPRGMIIYTVLSGAHTSYSDGIAMEELIDRNAETFESEEYQLLPLWKAAAADTPAGEKRTFVYRLKDYYDYYPLQIWFDLGKISGSDEEIYLPLLRRFFRFPVNEEHMVSVTVEKKKDGSILSLGVDGRPKGETYGTKLEGFSAVTEDACWYVFDNSGADGSSPLDTSLIPGGFGIYRIPYTRDQNGAASVDAEAARMVYPINERDAVLGIAQNEGELILFTQSDGAVLMSVIDPQSFKLLQTLELLRETEPAYLEKKAFFDDCLLAGLSGGRLALAQRSGDGEWSVVLTGDASVLYDTDYGMLGRSGTASWSWDGCRLACAEPVWAVHGSADFILSVYCREGLLCAGVFESTLDRDSPHEGGMSVYSDQGPECCSVSWHSTETEEK